MGRHTELFAVSLAAGVYRSAAFCAEGKRGVRLCIRIALSGRKARAPLAQLISPRPRSAIDPRAAYECAAWRRFLRAKLDDPTHRKFGRPVVQHRLNWIPNRKR